MSNISSLAEEAPLQHGAPSCWRRMAYCPVNKLLRTRAPAFPIMWNISWPMGATPLRCAMELLNGKWSRVDIDIRHGVRGFFQSSRRCVCRALASAGWLLLLVDVANAADQGAKPDPLVLGAFTDFSHDNNLYRVPDNAEALGITLPAGAQRDDNIFRVGVDLTAHGEYGRQTLSLKGNVFDQRYSHNDYLNNVSGNGELDWDWQTSGNLSGTLRADYSRWLNGFANTQNYNQDLISRTGYEGTLRRDVGARWTVVAGAGYSDSTHSAVDNSGDDQRATKASVGIEYQTSLGNMVGWDYHYAHGRYNNAQNDYHDDTARVRCSLLLAHALTFSGNVGVKHRDFPSATNNNFSGGVWNADLNWQPRERSSVVLAGWRELRVWQDAESNHYVSDGVRLAPVWDSGLHWRVSLGASWERDKYLGSTGVSSRDDTLKSVEGAVSYSFLKRLRLTLRARSGHRDSNIPAYVYDDQVASAGLAATW
jgi:Putative beta-barrel porin 2